MSEQEILLFSLGGRRMAAPVDSVTRIASSAHGESWIQSTALGEASGVGRGLVAAMEGREWTLAVDEVEGIERVASSSIHPLPTLAKDAMDTEGVLALVDREEELLLLVDLQRLIFESTKESQSDAEDK